MLSSEDFSLGSLSFDARSGELRTRAETRRLEPKAAAVLEMLCEHRSKVVGRQDLLDRCWGEGEGSDEALTQAIAQIRRALDELGEPGLVQTLAKRGYRLRETPAAVSVSPSPKPIAPANRRLVASVAAMLALVILIAWIIDPHGPRHFVKHAFGLGPGETH